MFTKKHLPKIYCKITIRDQGNIAFVDFYGLLAYKTVNQFGELLQEKRNSHEAHELNGRTYIDLDIIYHFLANENFIPISETFFYRDMEAKDQIGNNQ